MSRSLGKGEMLQEHSAMVLVPRAFLSALKHSLVFYLEVGLWAQDFSIDWRLERRQALSQISRKQIYEQFWIIYFGHDVSGTVCFEMYEGILLIDRRCMWSYSDWEFANGHQFTIKQDWNTKIAIFFSISFRTHLKKTKQKITQWLRLSKCTFRLFAHVINRSQYAPAHS